MEREKVFRWFSAVVQFLTQDEQTEKIKKIKEIFLIKAVDPTDVQVQLTKYLEGIQMEYTIEGITASKITTILHPDSVELNG
jgi:hypothetical protein